MDLRSEGLKSDSKKDFPHTQGIEIGGLACPPLGDLKEQNGSCKCDRELRPGFQRPHCPPRQPAVPTPTSCLDFLHGGRTILEVVSPGHEAQDLGSFQDDKPGHGIIWSQGRAAL